MIPIGLTANIAAAPWNDLPEGLGLGMIVRIGLLPDGTQSGQPVVMVAVEMPDGSVHVGQTTWGLWEAASRALPIWAARLTS